jgi:tetratricopeptide (TPR) repeat protein
MNSSKLVQVLAKIVSSEKKEITLRAFKQDPIIWEEFSALQNLEKIQEAWPGIEYAFTPASFALYKLNLPIQSNDSAEIQPPVELLETSMISFEEYMHAKTPVADFQLAAHLALALYKKSEQITDWTKLFREMNSQQNLESASNWKAYWGTPFALVYGWLEDPLAFLQALLQVEQPEFGLEILQHVIFSQPFDETTQIDLFKRILTTLPLSAQVIAVQQLNLIGKNSLAKAVAVTLFDRRPGKELNAKSILETWQSSEKSLLTANTNRQLAALAQYAGEFDAAENLLKSAEQNYAAELAGSLIQLAALKQESGKPDLTFIEQIPNIIMSDTTLQNEIAMLGGNESGVAENAISPLAAFLNANSIHKAGNETLAKQIASESSQNLWNPENNTPVSFESSRALNWNPRRLLAQLTEFGLWSEARRVVDTLLKQSPTDLNLHLQSLRIAEGAKDNRNRISALENITLFDLENSEKIRQLAKAYSDDNDWSSAFDNFDSLVDEFNSSEPSDWLGYAESALKTGQTPIALEYSQKVLTADMDNGKALAILGFAHHQSGEDEEALDCLNRSVRLAPDSVEPWLLMAELHQEKGEISQAIDTLQTAKNTFPGEKRIRLELAKKLIEHGQAAEALATLKEAGYNNVADLDSSLLMIQAQKALNLPGVDELIEKTYRAFPDSSEATFEYAESQLYKGNRAAASDLLESIITGVSATAKWQLAFADSILGEDYRNVHQTTLPVNEKVQRAKSILNQTLLAEPENTYAIKEGHAEKAFEFLSNLLKENSTQNSNWFDRIKAGFAWAAAFLQKFDVALGAIQNIVEAHPDWAAANQTLAEVDQATGDISGAVNQANQVLEVAPNVIQSAEWFANFMSNLGKKEEAEKTLQSLAKTQADKLPLLVKLAEMKLQSDDVLEAKSIADSIKRSLPKSKSDSMVLRAAKVFDQIGDTQAAVDALKFRLANTSIPADVVLADLAGYLRSKGKITESIKIIEEAEEKFGKQRWLESIKAEAKHANGESGEAYALVNALPESNEHQPDRMDLTFLPCDWQSMFEADPSLDSLEQALAFEAADYERVFDMTEGESSSAESKVNRIEADYALGSGAETIRWLESDAADEHIYADPYLSVQVSEIMMDAGQIQKAGEILMQALGKYPQNNLLKLSASRQSALSADWSTAEALFDQEMPAFSVEATILSTKNVCATRALIKAAIDTAHWNEAESWSKQIAEQQPKNQTAQLIRLLTLVKGLEFSIQNHDLGLKQHILSDQKMDEVKAKLAALIANLEKVKNPEFEHWCARGKVVLEPVQANVRRLALITPAGDDIAAMIMALSRSGQNNTALQLGKKHENEDVVLSAVANCLKNENPQKAFEMLEKAWKLKQVSPVTYALGAHVNAQQNEYYSAINQIEQALEYWPAEAGWHEFAAENWQAVGDSQNSTAHLEKAYQVDPESTALQLKLGKNYLQAKEIEKAIDCLKHVTQKEVNQYEGWEALAEAYYQAGQTEQALDAAKRASNANAFSVKPYLLSAQINLDQGKAAKALEQAQKAMQQEEKNAEVLLVLAKSWLANGNKILALQVLEKVPQIHKVSVPQLIEHARLVKEINGAANAKGMLESLAERYPDNLEVLNMLAESQLANGEKAAAEKAAQHSVKLQENQPQMQRFLGKLEFESGHLDQAIYHYSQAIALAPESEDAYLELSKVYEQQRDFKLALHTLNRALETNPKDLRTVMAAANLMRNAKEYGKAETFLRRASEITPNDLNVRRQLGAVIALNLVESSQEASSHI